MSWYCGSLIKESMYIKERGEIDSDEFNDLMSVETTIEKLYSLDILTEKELLIIQLFALGMLPFQMEKKLKLNRRTIAKIFEEITNKIAYTLGGVFTDEGYIDFLSKKYNLNDNKIQLAQNYIDSRNRFKIIRKIL